MTMTSDNLQANCYKRPIWLFHLRATGRHLTYGTTQCYLPSDTGERSA